MFVDERRDIVANVEDKPDRDKAGNAVTVNLQEIANDVSIQESHQKNFKFQASIATEFSAISEERRKAGMKSFKFLDSCFPYRSV